MQDAQRFIAEAEAAGASVRMMGDSSRYTESAWTRLGGRGFWLQQIFFTIRRLVYGLTLAMGALGTAAIAVGFSFNAMIEQQQLAFRIFTGSLAGARKEVQFLYNLAAHGPFEFTQVIQGARQMQAFGFTVEETNKLLVSLQDAMAGMGLDQAALDRATLALGQIRSSGRLLGQDLRQLEQLGLVSPEDLARRLQIPQAALSNIGQLNIPSKVAIDAIEAYWVERFHGAARDFQRTWTGQISTLKDYGRALFGAMVEPLQQKLEKQTLPTIAKIAQEAKKGFDERGMEGFFAAIDRGANSGTNFLLIWQRARDFFTPLLTIVAILASDFLFAFRVLGIGTKVALPLIFVLNGLLWVLRALNPILVPLIALWVAERSVKLLLIAATKAKIFWDLLDTSVTRLRGRAETYALIWMERRWIMTRLMTRAETIWIGVQLAAISVTEALTGAVETLTIAIMVNPFGLIITAAIAVVAGLVILYFKWKWFHNLINSIASWIWRHHYVLALVPVVGPAILVVTTIIKHFSTLVHWLKVIVSWAMKVVHWIGRIHAPHIHIPGSGLLGKANPFHWFAQGGEVIRGGLFGVGDSGPEIVALPAGAAVSPLRNIPVDSFAGAGAGPSVIELRAPIYLDRKKIGEAVDSYRLDKKARK